MNVYFDLCLRFINIGVSMLVFNCNTFRTLRGVKVSGVTENITWNT